MDDAYLEMKGVPEMKGSINAVISAQRRFYRPPSLSESFARSAENVLRANASNTSLDLLANPSPQTSPSHSPSPSPPQVGNEDARHYETKIVNSALRFLFHITLISIFESVFFFLYISKLEDNGINNTVGGFIQDAVQVCDNFTVPERVVTNDVLSLFINGTVIVSQGDAAFASRSAVNQILFLRSWIYVGSLGALFLILASIAKLRNIRIKWLKLVWENIALVTILAAYEYTFFSTIIYPYNPITGAEVARNAVQDLQGSCGLLT
jgi:hypothetical protein